MPKVAYVKKRFSTSALNTILDANKIIAEYESQGFALTLRQLFYQLVSRSIIPNTTKAYKSLGSIVNDARLAGLIDWNHITDRTRHLRALSHWNSPGDIITSAAASYRIDMWARQKYRPEVWIEKDALIGVIEQICTNLDVPFFSCRGYTSQSEMWVAGQRLHQYTLGAFKRKPQVPVVFHFGDHDPSGMDMTRDIRERLELFMGGVEVKRMALNMEQVKQFTPPPNPAKLTDTRATAYIAEFGDESWELDALDPKTITNLINKAILELVDQKIWKEDINRVGDEKELLHKVAEGWEEITENL